MITRRKEDSSRSSISRIEALYQALPAPFELDSTVINMRKPRGEVLLYKLRRRPDMEDGVGLQGLSGRRLVNDQFQNSQTSSYFYHALQQEENIGENLDRIRGFGGKKECNVSSRMSRADRGLHAACCMYDSARDAMF